MFLFNRFFTKTKVEISSSDENPDGSGGERSRADSRQNQGGQIMNNNNHRYILGENNGVNHSPAGNRKHFNSKSTLKTSLKQTTTPQTDDGIVYGSPRNAYSFF